MNLTVGTACYLVGPFIELAFMVVAFSYGGSYFASILKAAIIGSVAIIILPQLVWITIVLFCTVSMWNAVKRVARFLTRNGMRIAEMALTLQILCDWRAGRRMRRMARQRRRGEERLRRAWDEEYEKK